MREKRIALWDVDKTIRPGFIAFDLLDLQSKSGLVLPRVPEQVNLLYKDYKTNNLSYEEFARLLLLEWADGLRGVKYEDVLDQTSAYFNQDKSFYPYATRLFDVLRKEYRYENYLVTGEPQFVASLVGKRFKVKGFISSKFEVKKNAFTGEVSSFLASRHEKLQSIQEILSKYGDQDSLGFGDSTGDIEMLRSVKYPFCILPSEDLIEVAKVNNWIITDPNSIEERVSDILINI